MGGNISSYAGGTERGREAFGYCPTEAVSLRFASQRLRQINANNCGPATLDLSPKLLASVSERVLIPVGRRSEVK